MSRGLLQGGVGARNTANVCEKREFRRTQRLFDWPYMDLYHKHVPSESNQPIFVEESGILNVTNCVWSCDLLWEVPAPLMLERRQPEIETAGMQLEAAGVAPVVKSIDLISLRCRWGGSVGRGKEWGRMTEWWGSFCVSASISAYAFETTSLLWDKQRLGGTYATQAIAALLWNLCGKCTIAS